MAEIIPLIPLRGLTVFPNLVLHFDIGREKSIIALERAMMMNQTVFLATQKDAGIELPTIKEIYSVGTVAKVKQMLKLPDGNMRVLVDGQYRGKVTSVISDSPYFLVNVAELEEPETEVTADILALERAAKTLFNEYQSLSPRAPQDKRSGLDDITEPGRLADIIASAINLKTADAQKILATTDPARRLSRVVKLLTRETEILKLEDKISSKIKTSMSKSQKEYYLREQLRAIQEELGGGDDPSSEAEVWRKKLKKLKLDPAVTKKVEKEIDQFSKMPGTSPEAGVIRSYVENILDLPWNTANKTELDISKAQQILDEDHYGMDKVKDRILEYLAVQTLSKNNKAPILCLVGPPGVGKTSIAKSVARATGRKFVHMSLGGVRDEAEIRGHRRTYIGAIPGRIMTLLKECGTKNPVFLFDEVDKIGADFRGDPASALLEVLDPEQNREFVDHFLEVPFDISSVLFITTANGTDTIPRPLLDRMEVLELSGYTLEEKYNIAKRYLVPKQLKANGLSSKNISFRKGAILDIINYYTRESGVRGLEKNIGSVCRKVARGVVSGETEKHVISSGNIEEYLGRKKYHYDKLLGKNEVGVATGLAWTIVGGETLFIETAVLDGGGKLSLTGQLGDVMQESARAGISYIRANAKKLGINEDFYKDKDIHIHIPEGAVPKDGPSAGVTMCISVISALTGRPVRKDVAMTGEITLRGNILAVGGIKEKVLAAHRMGIRKVLLPQECRADLEELPQTVKDSLEFVLISKVDDAIREALL
ncbi:MAG: endopeptidase La [Firmicutes bacterium]|nr:endopeptidase La [Bacillota bacterium]